MIFFSSHSSFPSALQVVARDRSQRKPRTSKFLMVGKLGFDVFMSNVLNFLVWMLNWWYLRCNGADFDIN